MAAYRLGMESGPAVSQPEATTLTVVKGAAGGKLAETTERCRAAIAAAEACGTPRPGLPSPRNACGTLGTQR